MPHFLLIVQFIVLMLVVILRVVFKRRLQNFKSLVGDVVSSETASAFCIFILKRLFLVYFMRKSVRLKFLSVYIRNINSQRLFEAVLSSWLLSRFPDFHTLQP